jgi:cell division protein FtsZ
VPPTQAPRLPTPRPVLDPDDDVVPVASLASARSSAQPDVPAFLSTEAEPTPITGALEVPRIFTDEVPRRERDELDVPDFLK